jgi:hypothetical protein
MMSIAELKNLVEQGKLAQQILDNLESLQPDSTKPKIKWNNPEHKAPPPSPWRFLVKGENLHGDEKFGHDYRLSTTHSKGDKPEYKISYITQRPLPYWALE